jgi:hypothetical protein
MEVDGMAGSEPEVSNAHDVPSETASKDGDFVATKVNVAFPFSSIKVQEPSEELIALAALVRDLAEIVAEVAPDSDAHELGRRARALAARLG